MSDLGLCTNPECTSTVKWDRETWPECPVCGEAYQPQMNKPGEEQPATPAARDVDDPPADQTPATPADTEVDSAALEPPPCPTCEAVGKDVRCRRPNGHTTPKPHKDRILVAP